MAKETDKKFLLNAQMLGAFESDGQGAFVSIEAADAIGLVDTELSSGINGANIISAINSAYAAAGGGPQGERYAIQMNSPVGTFSGSTQAILGAQQDNSMGIMRMTHQGTMNRVGGDFLSGSFTVSTVAAPSVAVVSVLGSGAGAGQMNLTQELQADGGIDVNSGNFNVASANGNTSIAGTLDVVGLSTIGQLDASGAGDFAGDFSVATNKFTVASATGNTEVGGTLGVTGVATFTADPVFNGGDITNGTTTAANNIFATSTGKTTLGGGAVDLSAAGAATTVKGTLNVDQGVTLDTTLGVTGIATFTASPVLNGGNITNGTTGNANNIFATSTGKTTLGGGAVDLSAAGAATTVKGTLNVDQAVTLDTTLGVTGITTLDAALKVDATISGSSTAMAAGGYQLVGTNASGARKVYSLTVAGGILLATEGSAP